MALGRHLPSQSPMPPNMSGAKGIAEQISMSTNVKAFRYVYYRDIPDYLDMGWMADIPPDFARLNWYGIVMVWLCECKIPGGSHDKR